MSGQWVGPATYRHWPGATERCWEATSTHYLNGSVQLPSGTDQVPQRCWEATSTHYLNGSVQLPTGTDQVPQRGAERQHQRITSMGRSSYLQALTRCHREVLRGNINALPQWVGPATYRHWPGATERCWEATSTHDPHIGAVRTSSTRNAILQNGPISVVNADCFIFQWITYLTV